MSPAHHLEDVRDAARNNADWCDAFCRAHGIVGRFEQDSWSSPARTPPLYPDAVTLAPSVPAESLLRCVDERVGCSIKDSFADLDLAPAGFHVLFRAVWLRRSPADSHPPPSGWSIVGTPAELDSWKSAWNAPTVFPDALLAEPDVAVLLRDDSLAGAVANRSAQVTGLSNVFARDGDLAAAWTGATETAEALWEPRPVVGYASGGAVDAARAAGFVTIGELAVWLRS